MEIRARPNIVRHFDVAVGTSHCPSNRFLRPRASRRGKPTGIRRSPRPRKRGGSISTSAAMAARSCLNEFRKEFPEIKIVSTNGAGNSLGTRIVAEARAGAMVADLYSGGAVTNFEILYKGKVLDSIKSALIVAGSARRVQMVRRQAPLQRSGTAACVHLHRQSDFGESLFQHQPGQSQGVQIVLGFGPAQVERQIRFPRSHRHRHRAVVAVFLLSS